MTIPVARPSFTLRRFAAVAIVLAVALAGATALPTAQTGGQPAAQTAAPTAAKKALTVDDYTKWRSIAGQEVSADGKWVAYTLQLTNTLPAEAKPVLRSEEHTSELQSLS